MKQISSLDLFYLTEEFKILENQRIETFYLDEDVFYMKVFIKGKGNLFLTNKISKFIYLSEKKQTESSQIPKSFALFLRKHLKNSYITKLEQIKNERILIISIDKKNKENEDIIKYKLIIELFSNGNIILTDENFNIINLLNRKIFKDRSLKNKEKYQFPPQKEISFLEIEKNEEKKKLIEKLKKSELSLVKFLAIEFGIGGKYSEEIVFRAKIDKNKISNSLNEEEIENLIETIINFNKEDLSPRNIVNKEDKILDFIPKKFLSINEKQKENNSFNDSVFNYFKNYLEENKNKNYQLNEKEIEKKINIIKKQEKLKEHILVEYERLNNIGNKIYENYSLIENLINQINLTAKEKGWDYVLEKIKEDEKLKKIIKKIDPKKNEIILDL
jgi:predicted ribosome quality control (RQC) complex YloA/Tae2 family protein